MSKNIQALIIALIIIFIVIPTIAWFLLSARSERAQESKPTVSEPMAVVDN